MKAVLINPSWGGLVSSGIFNRKWPPLCLLNCAALLEEAGVNVEIIDARAKTTTQEEIIGKAAAADRVFVTSSPLDRWQCPNLGIDDFVAVLSGLRKDNLHIMGAHATVYPEMVLKATGARSVIRGEPEMTILELCKSDTPAGVKGTSYLAGGAVIDNPERPPLDLDDLPIPAYHLVNLDDYAYELLGDRLVLLETSRGCPYACIFCFKHMYGGRAYRRKSVAGVARDLDYAVRKNGAKSLYFIDLEFTLDKGFVLQLCEHMIRERYDLQWCCQTRADTVDAELLGTMRRAGCRLIHYGVETGSQKVMDRIGKKLGLDAIEAGIRMTREAGMDTACFFMFGLPGETSLEMEETVKFALKLNPTYASFHAAVPFPGTALHAMLESGEPFPCAYTSGHSPDELRAAVRKAFLRFYMRPTYLASRLLGGDLSSLKKQLKLFAGYIR